MAQSHAPPVALRMLNTTYPTAIRSMGGVKLNIDLHIISKMQYLSLNSAAKLQHFFGICKKKVKKNVIGR